MDRTVGTVLAHLATAWVVEPCSLGPDIAIRASDFQAIMDSVQRATTAVKQAQRLATAAARALQDECAALASVKQNLETIAAVNGFEFSIQF